MSATDPSRPRGLLNERERRYLLGQTDIKPKSQAERDIRATIRNRVRHAIHDFALLFYQMEDRDIEQVFDPRANDIAEMRTALEETLGLLYRATINYHPPFPYLAKEGIQRAEQTHFDRYVKATIDVEPTAPVDPTVIKEKVEAQRPQDLTVEEATWIAETIIESDAVSFTDLDQAHDQVRNQHAGRDDTSPSGDTDHD